MSTAVNLSPTDPKARGSRAVISSLTPDQRNRLELVLKRRGSAERGGDVIERTGVGPKPLSHGQERLWFIDRLEPAPGTYNLAWALRLKGKLDVGALQNALDCIAERHETLRTVFREVEGAPYQFVEAARPVEMLHLDLRDDPGEERIQRELSQEARRRFHLDRDQLLRAALLQLRPEEFILLLTVHHISADGWSRSILFGELSEFYTAFVQKRAPAVPPLSVSYSDFAQWQRRSLEAPNRAKELEFWKQKLSGIPGSLNLLADYPRRSTQSYNGAREVLAIDKSLATQLKDLGRGENATLFMTLLAAFQILLHRYSGDSDIAVGTPAASRERVETEALIGFFVNTVVMRGDLSGTPTFRQLLARIRDVTLEAYAHQNVPFERLVDHLRTAREKSHSPIFQTMFVLLNAPAPLFQPVGLTAEVVEVETGATQFDLVLEAIDKPGQMFLRLSYCTDLFEAATAKRLLGHYETLLRAAVQNPDQPISQIPLLPDTERQDLLVVRNQTRTAYPARTIAALFDERSARAPQAIAVAQEGRRWTYQELSQHSDRIAQHLRTLGVGRGALVGICVERSMEMLAALLGIWKAGGAYLPLDPSYPKSRLSFIIEDAAPAVILTEAPLLGGIPDTGAKIVLLEDCRRDLPTSEPGSMQEATPEDRAYVIYTSGSTGKPKGVAIRHGSLTNLLHAMLYRLEAKPEDTVLAITTISFDIAGLELFLPLLAGARVFIVGREIASDGARLANAIEGSGATIVQGTPATWQMLLDSGWSPKESLKMLCGGEALPAALAGKLRRGGNFWNVYGPTETTIWSSATRLLPDRSEVPIGGPIDNTEFYVLDAERQPVPLGVAGELYIGGDGLAEGYWKRPELTAEKFVSNPFSKTSGERLYRTGDLVRYLPDGNIDFLGRIDSQVKIRGFRIELGEIETVLARHPAVSQCAVIAREDEPGDKQLAAYFESRAGVAWDISDLRARLKQELPDYMVPAAIVHMDKMPLTPNGKIDRKLLPTPQKLRREAPEAHEAPRDPMEQTIAAIWAKILKQDRIGVQDDFFEMGGHSLAAVRMLYEVKKATGRSLPLATLLQASTVEGLATALRAKASPGEWSSLVPIQPLGSKPPLFLIHGAEGNILLYRPMLRHFSADQPVFGLQSQGLNENSTPFQDIPAMASHYVQEILAVQPNGPYLLAGYCMGGSIAFEIAQQLTATGRKVELVALLDCHNSDFERKSRVFFQGPRHFLQNLWFHALNALSLSSGDRNLFLREKMDIEWARIRLKLQAAFDRSGSASGQQAFPHLLLQKVNDLAAQNYRPQPYVGRVAVIRSRSYFAGLVSESLGWDGSVPEGLQIHELPMHPKGMLVEPFCRSLADTLQSCMKQALETRERPYL